MAESPRSTIAIWLVALVLAGLAAMRLFSGGGEPPASPVRIDGGPAAAGPAGGGDAPGSSTRSGDVLYVHVAGAVRRPGLIRVARGSRVATALERAGGPTRRADLALVNLAAPVQDGQQIVVPVLGAAGVAGVAPPGAAAPGAAPGSGAASAPGAATPGPPAPKVHLSTATVEQLDEIDGIGPTLAERIVEYRTEHGGFRSLDELAQVDGIGEKRLAALREQLQP